MKQYKATVYSLYLHDGYCWITIEACTVVVNADSKQEAMTKLEKMTDCHFDLEELS